jgi:hypothetical protein
MDYWSIVWKHPLISITPVLQHSKLVLAINTDSELAFFAAPAS